MSALRHLPLDQIRVGDRHRRDLGNIAALADSIKILGLLHPVVIDEHGTLIAGERRIAALKHLGRTEIPCHVIDLGDQLLGERDENLQRLDFAPDELVAIGRSLEEREREKAKQRMSEGGKGAKISLPSDRGRVVDKVAAIAGVSGRTYEKARAVVEAAEHDPERYGDLVQEMKNSRKVNSPFRKLRQRQDEQRVLGLEPMPGRHRTLIIDPPWEYGWLSYAERAAPGYATMTVEELFALPVPTWAEDNSHLYLWTPNNFLPVAVRLMAHWGFAHKTVITWVKLCRMKPEPKPGLGIYFRNTTEQVLFGIRGDLETRRNDMPTHFEAPVGKIHSEKPDAFYDIVLSASYPTYGEAFQRKARPQFQNLYRQREPIA